MKPPPSTERTSPLLSLPTWIEQIFTEQSKASTETRWPVSCCALSQPPFWNQPLQTRDQDAALFHWSSQACHVYSFPMRNVFLYWLSSPVPVSSCLSCSAQRGWTWSQPFCSEGRPLLTPSSASNLTGLSIHQVRPMAGMSPQGGKYSWKKKYCVQCVLTWLHPLDFIALTVLHSKTSLKGRILSVRVKHWSFRCPW